MLFQFYNNDNNAARVFSQNTKLVNYLTLARGWCVSVLAPVIAHTKMKRCFNDSQSNLIRFVNLMRISDAALINRYSRSVHTHHHQLQFVITTRRSSPQLFAHVAPPPSHSRSLSVEIVTALKLHVVITRSCGVIADS